LHKLQESLQLPFYSSHSAVTNRRHNEPDLVGTTSFARPRAGLRAEIQKNPDFLKCPASKSLERNEANQINNRYDEHGS
jgi:hypothetical protein